MDNINKIQKSFFEEKDVLPFTNLIKDLWPKGLALNWFWLAFQALEKAGLTYYESDEEEMNVRERIVLLIVIYYEFCHVSAMNESPNFNQWEEKTIRNVKNDFSKDVNDLLLEVKKALVSYFGSEETALAELWINCIEGSNNTLIKTDEKNEMLFHIATSGYELQNINYERAHTWFIGWSNGVEDYEGISI